MTTYTLFGQPASPATLFSDFTAYTFGTQFSVSQAVALTGIWWYSPPSAGVLPAQCGIYQVTGTNTGTLVTSNTSPSWSGAVGSGWVKCSFNGSVVLQPGNNYRVCVAGGNGSVSWYSDTHGYWTTGGPGASGITNGPLTAPNSSGSDGANQGAFFSGSSTLTYPTSSFQNGNYWIDVEVNTQFIQYNTGATASAATATSVNFTIPNTGGLNGTGVIVDDVMLLSFECFTETATPPSIAFSGGGGAWQLVPMTDGSANPQVASGAGIWSYGFAYYRVATLADIGATVTITETGSAAGTTWLDVAMVAYTGANKLNPIDRAGGAQAGNIAGTTGVTCPTETARISGDWAVYLGPCGPGISSGLTGPAGSTLRKSIVDGSGIGSAIWDSNGTTGLASVGGGTIKSTNGGSSWFEAFTVCLAPAGVYMVQSASSTTIATSTVTATLGAGATPGDTLIVAEEASSTGVNPTVSGIKLGGSADNFAQLVTVGTGVTSAAIVQIWADPNCAGGQTSVVVTYSGAPTTAAVWVYEFLGLGPAPVLDQSSTAFSTATQAAFSSGTTPTTTQANELWFGANAGYNTTITPPSSPWNNSTILNSGSRYLIAGYQVVSATGTATYSGTYSPNSYETAAVVTLKAGASGGGGNYTGQVANVAVAAPYGAASVATPGALAGVLVAAPVGTASSGSPATVNGQVANVSVAALLGQARGTAKAKGGLFLVHFP